MKRLNIEKKSWHYRLAQYGGIADRSETDLCSYFWALVRGILHAPLLVLAGVAAGTVMLVYPLLFLWTLITTGYCVFVGPEIFGFAIWGGIAIFSCALLLQGAADKRRDLPPGIVRSAYRGWKEKTCVLIEVSE